MKLDSGYDDLAPRSEMIPLLDCVFLVLVFFVYAMLSMVVHRGVWVDLPAASQARIDHQSHVTISIRADNSLIVEGQPVTLDQLIPSVRRAADTNADRLRSVSIDGDGGCNYATAVTVMDRLGAAGFEAVLLSTRRGDAAD